jgi:hypothetical protein
MKRIWREFIFWGFVGLFFILAPYILLNTAGYRYQFGSARFIRTGVLSISASPRSVAVFLNGDSADENTPAVLKNLIPGTYAVELVRDEHHPWRGEVDIIQGETTFLNNIMLFLADTPDLITQEAIQEIAIHPNEELIAYSINIGAITQIWLQAPSTGETTFIHEQSLDTNLMLHWSAEGGYLLVDGEQNYLYTKNVQEIQISDRGEWEFDQTQDHLVYQNIDDGVNKLNLETEDVSSIEALVLPSPFEGSNLQLVDNGHNVEIRDVNKDDYALIAILPAGHYELLKEDAPYLLLSRNSHELLLLNLEAEQPKLLEASGTLWDWQSKTRELVYSDGHEVTTFETENGHSEFITRQSESITSLHWLPEGEHILVTTETNLSVFEQFAQAKQRFSLVLAEHLAISTVWLSDNGNDAYYLVEEPTIALMRLELRK